MDKEGLRAIKDLRSKLPLTLALSQGRGDWTGVGLEVCVLGKTGEENRNEIGAQLPPQLILGNQVANFGNISNNPTPTNCSTINCTIPA